MISYFQYQELVTYYENELPYIAVEKYKKTINSETKTEPVDPQLLINQALTQRDNKVYTKHDLGVLASDENECYVDKNRDESMEVIQQEIEQTAKETPSYGRFTLSAVGAVLMDADSRRVLYGKNEEKVLAMASTTKIMTCIIALEQADLDDVVTVSSYAAKMPDVQLNIVAGEQYYLRDLLYSLMLESHNDSAVAIAEHIGGSVEGFAELMNAKVKELGCINTHFVTPNGLDAPGHETTAKELGLIACYAIRNPEFVEITNTAAHEFKELTKGKTQHVTNKNRFLYMMDGAMGVKTGFTNNAGYCFVGAVKRDDRTLVSVVLGSGWPPHKTYKWNDTIALMNYGIHQFTPQLIMNQKVELPEAFVEGGQISKVRLTAEANLTTLVRKDEKIRAEYTVLSLLKAPVSSEEKAGVLSIYIGDDLFAEVPVYTEGACEKLDYSFCFIRVMDGMLWMKH